MKPSENFAWMGLAAFIRIRTNFFLFLMFQLYQFVVTNFKNIVSDCKHDFTLDSGQCVSLPCPLKILQLQLDLVEKTARAITKECHKITSYNVQNYIVFCRNELVLYQVIKRHK
jgi:hypothetical protein